MGNLKFQTSLTPTVSIENNSSSSRDWVFELVPIGCAIQCAAMPFVVAYLSTLGLNFLADESIYKWIASACFLIAIISFVPGFKKHGSWLPTIVGAVGLVFITCTAFGVAGDCMPTCVSDNPAGDSKTNVRQNPVCERCKICNSGDPEIHHTALALSPRTTLQSDLLDRLGTLLTPLGGLLLFCAHLFNRRFGCKCSCCNECKCNCCNSIAEGCTS